MLPTLSEFLSSPMRNMLKPDPNSEMIESMVAIGIIGETSECGNVVADEGNLD